MADVALVTVPDEGAADVVRAALEEVGIPVELQRAYPEHPYRGSALATPWKVLVPRERLAEAEEVLARTQREMAEEVDAQAGASAAAAEADKGAAPTRRPRITWAVALAFLLPLPVVCFYARAWRRGALWLGLTLVPFALVLARAIWSFAPGFAADSPLDYGDYLLLLFVAAKAADLFVALALIVLGRSPARA